MISVISKYHLPILANKLTVQEVKCHIFPVFNLLKIFSDFKRDPACLEPINANDHSKPTLYASIIIQSSTGMMKYQFLEKPSKRLVTLFAVAVNQRYRPRAALYKAVFGRLSGLLLGDH